MQASANQLDVYAALERMRAAGQDETAGYHMVVELTGDRQGPIKAEDGTPRLPVLGFEWGLTSTSATAPDKALARREYRPLFVMRRCDAATASIMSGLASNEGMTVKLSMFESNTDKQAVWELNLRKARLLQHMTYTGGPIGGAQEVFALAAMEFELQTAAQQSSGIRGAVRVFSDSVN